MSWDELEPVEVPGPNEALQALERSVARAFSGSPELQEYLEKVVGTLSYTRGATLDELTFREGQRYMARLLLKLGGSVDD